MKKLYILRGIPGCGKSTFLRERGLEPYSLSSDNIRLMLRGPELNELGFLGISGIDNRKTFKILFEKLEERMKRGELVFVDATHATTDSINAYKHLVLKYRYRAFVIDFSDILPEEAKKRNKKREEYKFVREASIDKMYNRIKSSKIPSFVNVLPYDKFDDEFKLEPLDLSSYKKIHHIGDIHGCVDPLKEYLKDGLPKDEMFIFTGDYIDRGIQNKKVMKILLDLSKRNNVMLLEGNHEIHLYKYAKNEKAYSSEFEKHTKHDLVDIKHKELRVFYRSLISMAYYTYGDKEILVSHGGLSALPDNLNKVSHETFIRGVGGHSIDIDRIFEENTNEKQYQIHGHRNYEKKPLDLTKRSFSLESKVEKGGFLRIVTLSDKGFEKVEIKNNTFRKTEEELIHESTENLLKSLRESDDIKEHSFGDISSFNFKNKVFYDGSWNFKNVKARGLFINTKYKEIVARGYEKFFNINELPETKYEKILKKSKYPLKAYTKENGFLGLVGYDIDKNELVFTSKSMINGEYAGYLKNLFYKKFEKTKEDDLKDYLKVNKKCLAFEVVDMKNDPHIIDYEEDSLILLDVIDRESKFSKLSYEDLKDFSDKFGFKCKVLSKTINTEEEFKAWYKEVSKPGYLENGKNIEGYVIEDSEGFMCKIKLYYYRKWKHLRVVKNNVDKYKVGSFEDKESNEFHKYLITLSEDERKQDIGKLRKLFKEK